MKGVAGTATVMTQEMRDIVIRDWQSALMSMSPVRLAWVPNPPEMPAGALWLQDMSGDPGDWPRMVLVWSTPEARLKAWAMAGAPVLAPQDDGRPSFAEWLAAMTASAWGEPLNINTMPGGDPFSIQWQNGPHVRLWTKRQANDHGASICLAAPYSRFGGVEYRDCATPAQLRELLDFYARPL